MSALYRSVLNSADLTASQAAQNAAFAAITGAGLVGAKAPSVGTIARTVQHILADRPHVRDFGAVGDGGADDTNALRAAHLVSARLRYGAGPYRITGSITLYVQDVIGECKERTIIKPSGNFPAFINSQAEFISGCLKNFFIDYGEVAPTVEATDGLKVGIRFSGAEKWPTFYSIEDVTVRGGWYAYLDDTGTYGSKLEQVFAWNCFGGLRKQNGTTMVFENCITLGCANPWYLKDVLAATLKGCASDGAAVTAGNSANRFEGCMGLTIAGWDCEGNSITGEGASLFSFNFCTGSARGYVGLGNTMAANGADSVALFKVSNNSQMDLSGIRTKFNAGSLTFTGTGTVYALLVTDNSRVFVSGSNIDAPSGGTPAARFAMAAIGGSTITYAGTAVSGSLFGAYEVADMDAGTWVPVPSGLTVTGAPTYSGKYSRVGKSMCYTLTISANGGTTASVGGSTAFTGLPINPAAAAVCAAVNNVAIGYGDGLVTAAGVVYPPAWAATPHNVHVTFTCQIP